MTAFFTQAPFCTDTHLQSLITALRALEGLPPPDRREVEHVVLRCEMALRQHRPGRKKDALLYGQRFRDHLLRKHAAAEQPMARLLDIGGPAQVISLQNTTKM